MLTDFVLINRERHHAKDQPFALGDNWIEWTTCVRRIALGFCDFNFDYKNAAHEADKIYFGFDAYKFLIQVVCGLHSPVRGETEVHGQFRELLDRLDRSHKLTKLLTQIHAQARKVRAEHLQGLGSQSYGSFARKKLKTVSSIHVLGAGHLTSELMPWLLKLQVPVEILARDTAKAQNKFSHLKNVSVSSIDIAQHIKDSLIVAAPICLPKIDNTIQVLLDYRSERFDDQMHLSNESKIYRLSDIFNEIEHAKLNVDTQTSRALQLIDSMSMI